MGYLTRRNIEACPKRSLLTEHYAEDGTCNCTRREQIDRELELLEGRRRRLHQYHRDVVARIRELRRTR